MKFLFILNDPTYGTERSYSTLPLARNLAARQGNEIRMFLLGDARCIGDGELVPGSSRGTMDQLAEWSMWAEKLLVF